jgi:hypothetical protein
MVAKAYLPKCLHFRTNGPLSNPAFAEPYALFANLPLTKLLCNVPIGRDASDNVRTFDPAVIPD